jgi:hypothetical protein
MKDNFEFRESISPLTKYTIDEMLSLLTSGWSMIIVEKLYSM